MSNVINLDLKKEHSKKTLYWILRYIIKHHKHYGDVGYIPTSWLALSKFLNYKNHFTIKKCLWTPDGLRVYVNRIDPEVKNWFVDNFDFNQILINTNKITHLILIRWLVKMLNTILVNGKTNLSLTMI